MKNRLDGHNGHPVLCLTIIDHPLSQEINHRTQLLLGVRSPVQKTHIGVLSSFTKRISETLLSSIEEELGKNSLVFSLGDESKIITTTQFAVEYLLYRKLGMIDNSENIQKFSCKFGYIETGIPKGSDPHDQRENVTMYNLICHIEGFMPPNETVSYSDIGWRNVGDFVNNRLSGTEICEGLCISTSKNALVLAGDFS